MSRRRYLATGLALMMLLGVSLAQPADRAAAYSCSAFAGDPWINGNYVNYHANVNCDTTMSFLRVDMRLRYFGTNPNGNYSYVGSYDTGNVPNVQVLNRTRSAGFTGCGGYYQTEMWGYWPGGDFHRWSQKKFLVNPACNAPSP